MTMQQVSHFYTTIYINQMTYNLAITHVLCEDDKSKVVQPRRLYE